MEQTLPSHIYLVDKNNAPTLFVDVFGDISSVVKQRDNARFSDTPWEVRKRGAQVGEMVAIRVNEINDLETIIPRLQHHLYRTTYPPRGENAKIDITVSPELRAQLEAAYNVEDENFLFVLLGAARFEKAGVAIPENIEAVRRFGSAHLEFLYEGDIELYFKAYKALQAQNQPIPEDMAVMKEIGLSVLAHEKAHELRDRLYQTFVEIRGPGAADRYMPYEEKILTRYNKSLEALEPSHKALFEECVAISHTMVMLGTYNENSSDAIIESPKGRDLSQAGGVQINGEDGRAEIIAISGNSLSQDDQVVTNLIVAEEIGHYLDKALGFTASNGMKINFSFMQASEDSHKNDVARLMALRNHPQDNEEAIRVLDERIAKLPMDSSVWRQANKTDDPTAHARKVVLYAIEDALEVKGEIYNILFEQAQKAAARGDMDTTVAFQNLICTERMVKLSTSRQLMIGANGEGREEARAVITAVLPPITGRAGEAGKETSIANLSGAMAAFDTRVEQLMNMVRTKRESGAEPTLSASPSPTAAANNAEDMPSMARAAAAIEKGIMLAKVGGKNAALSVDTPNRI